MVFDSVFLQSGEEVSNPDRHMTSLASALLDTKRPTIFAAPTSSQADELIPIHIAIGRECPTRVKDKSDDDVRFSRGPAATGRRSRS
jgi:hypothetical protein